MIAKFKKTSRKRSVWAVLVLVALACITLTDAYSAPPFIFGSPTNLGPTVNSSSDDDNPSISADGLELFFSSDRPGGYGNGDIYVTTRETTDDDFGPPVNLGPTINSSSYDACPSISADGLELYFGSLRPGGFGNCDLWVTSRPTTDDPWGTPMNLGATVNSSDADNLVEISADGLELFFGSDRPGGLGGWDIWVTTRTTINDDWREPVNLGPTVNSSSGDGSPSISANSLLLFFDSSRPGVHGLWDIWVTTRATKDDDWGLPVNLGPAVNTVHGETGPSISADGLQLYFSEWVVFRPGGVGSYDLWQVEVDIVDNLMDKQDLKEP